MICIVYTLLPVAGCLDGDRGGAVGGCRWTVGNKGFFWDCGFLMIVGIWSLSTCAAEMIICEGDIEKKKFWN